MCIYIYVYTCIPISLSLYIYIFVLLPIIPLRGSACKAPCHTCTCADVDAELPCHHGSFLKEKSLYSILAKLYV